MKRSPEQITGRKLQAAWFAVIDDYAAATVSSDCILLVAMFYRHDLCINGRKSCFLDSSKNRQLFAHSISTHFIIPSERSCERYVYATKHDYTPLISDRNVLCTPAFPLWLLSHEQCLICRIFKKYFNNSFRTHRLRTLYEHNITFPHKIWHGIRSSI